MDFQRAVKFFIHYQTQILLILVCVISLIFFYPSLNYYFFQDDWFVLNWVRTGDFVSLFQFRTDIIYWRPLSMPIFFFLNYKLFGLNPFSYHIIAFILFFCLVISIYKLFKLLLDNHKAAIFGSFLYSIWAIHFVSLSWLSTTSYIIGSLFQVLAFFFFIKFIKNKIASLLLISFVFFIFGIASSELTLVLPITIFSWLLIVNKSKFYKYLLLFILVDIIYIILRFLIFPIPAKGDYALNFGFNNIVNNLVWYLGWSLGLPESFKSLIFPSLPHQSFKVITQFWQITLSFFLLTVVLSKIFISSLKYNSKHYLFGFAFLILGLLPILPLKNHSFPMYLSFAGIGFIYIILQSLKRSHGFYWVIFLILWIFAGFQNLQFTRATHWVRNEQAISKAYVIYMKKNFKNPTSNSVFILKPANIEFAKLNNFVLVETEDTLKQSLNDQDAGQVIYKDSTLRSFYINSDNLLNLQSGGLEIYEVHPQEN